VRVTYTAGSVTIASEVKTLAEAMEFAGSIAEVFAEKCGCCGSNDIRLGFQSYQDKQFRKLICNKCTANCLIFSNRDNGSVWIARKDKDGQKLPSNGWSIYKPSGQPRGNGGYGSAPRQEPDLPVNEDSRLPDGEVPF